MKCQKCGTEYEANFCPNCGTPSAVQNKVEVQQPTTKNDGIRLIKI